VSDAAATGPVPAAALPRCFLGLPAPAKINRFLHVVGRRSDGYHEIESVFEPIDLCDTLDFMLRTDGRIERVGDLTGPEAGDLAVRAALALRAHAAAAPGAPPGIEALGATIGVEKRIPVGAGLGGGSSDAATTLIALNRLWNLGLERATLARIGRALGADVPFFLGAGPAFVEGVGERCTPVCLPRAWHVLVFPQVHVSTAEIFQDPKLTRDRKRTTIAGFSACLSGGKSGPGSAGSAGADPVAGSTALDGFGVNDLEPVACRRFPEVARALEILGSHGPARMSGSGSAVFRVVPGQHEAQALLEAVRAQMPAAWSAWAVPALPELPLAQW
jgi:4-diphosphocytidyl-2-C-methyl-D-erythritol kinase